MTPLEEVIKELEKLANDCRIQERIITQMRINQILEKLRRNK